MTHLKLLVLFAVPVTSTGAYFLLKPQINTNNQTTEIANITKPIIKEISGIQHPKAIASLPSDFQALDLKSVWFKKNQTKYLINFSAVNTDSIEALGSFNSDRSKFLIERLKVKGEKMKFNNWTISLLKKNNSWGFELIKNNITKTLTIKQNWAKKLKTTLRTTPRVKPPKPIKTRKPIIIKDAKGSVLLAYKLVPALELTPIEAVMNLPELQTSSPTPSTSETHEMNQEPSTNQEHQTALNHDQRNEVNPAPTDPVSGKTETSQTEKSDLQPIETNKDLETSEVIPINSQDSTEVVATIKEETQELNFFTTSRHRFGNWLSW